MYGNISRLNESKIGTLLEATLPLSMSATSGTLKEGWAEAKARVDALNKFMVSVENELLSRGIPTPF